MTIASQDQRRSDGAAQVPCQRKVQTAARVKTQATARSKAVLKRVLSVYDETKKQLAFVDRNIVQFEMNAKNCEQMMAAGQLLFEIGDWPSFHEHEARVMMLVLAEKCAATSAELVERKIKLTRSLRQLEELKATSASLVTKACEQMQLQAIAASLVTKACEKLRLKAKAARVGTKACEQMQLQDSVAQLKERISKLEL